MKTNQPPHRKTTLTVLAMLSCFGALTGLVPTASAEQPTSLDEAIETALNKSFSLRQSALKVEVAQSERRAAQAHYGPVLKAEANVIAWDEEQFLSLGSGGGAGPLPPPTTPYEMIVAGLVQGFSQPVSIRDQVTTQAKLTLAQPLSMLYTIHLAAGLAEQNVEASRIERSVAEQKVALDVVVAYYRLLQAAAVNANDKASVGELEAQLERMQHLADGGVLARSELLKIKLAIAATKQQEFKSRGNVELARSGLAMTMGLAPDTAIVPTTQPEVGEAHNDIVLATALDRALKNRRELAELEVRISQADGAVALAKAAMIPDITAVGTISHDTGSSLAPENSYFGGLFASWNVFEFGATYRGIETAEAKRSQALIGREQLEHGIRFEVQKAHRDANTAAAALEVASLAEEVARDSYTIEESRVAQGVATATDLIDAEKALTEARNNELLATYEFLIAYASLKASMGDPLTATTLTPRR